MDEPSSTMATKITQAAIAFEQQRTGHVPRSATVVLSDDTLVITLHGALSPAEKALAKTPAGIAQLQEFHRQLFANASESLRQEPSPSVQRPSETKRWRPSGSSSTAAKSCSGSAPLSEQKAPPVHWPSSRQGPRKAWQLPLTKI